MRSPAMPSSSFQASAAVPASAAASFDTPFVDGVQIEPSMRESEYTATAGAYLGYLRRSAFGLKWLTEDRADDEFPTRWDTPVWAGTSHKLTFYAVTGVEMQKGFAVIRTTDLAPRQGPSIQRVPDEEGINRMRVVHLQRTGEDTIFAPHVERHLLHMLPGGTAGQEAMDQDGDQLTLFGLVPLNASQGSRFGTAAAYSAHEFKGSSA